MKPCALDVAAPCAVTSRSTPMRIYITSISTPKFSRLRDLGIVFVQAPTPAGEVKVAVLNDTCGNLIQLVETPPDG